MDPESPASIPTKLVIGAPRMPPGKRRLRQLSRLLSDLEAVREAHLPDVFEVGSDEPARPVLMLVVDPPAEIPAVLETVRRRLRSKLGRRGELEVRAVTLRFPLLETIREAGCVVGWRD